MEHKNIRQYPRVVGKFTVEYSLGDRRLRGHATTLGGAGLFLEEAVLPEGAELSIRFRPAKHLPIIAARATVCYRIPGRGSGLNFTQIRPEHQQAILRLILHKTGDRRNSPRASFATQIYFRDLMSLAFSRNLSPGGMFVETREPLPVGSRIEVRFHLKNSDPVMVAAAEVRYCVEKLGMGVSFIDMGPLDRKRIIDYVGGSFPLPDQTTRTGLPS